MTKLVPSITIHGDVVVPENLKPANFRRKSNVLSIAIMAVVVPGLFATVALPAYAATGTSATVKAQRVTAEVAKRIQADAQSVAVDAAASTTVQRDQFGATSLASLQQATAVAARVAYRGPSVASLLANPPYPNFNLAAVPGVAARYFGVPYVYGGDNPAGFDCSGFTQFVYAQFGIALPHSAAAQGRLGTPIARSAALPGDVVVMDGGSHVGIYIGGGRMIDAPEPGGVVSARAIYDNSYYIVRFGI